MKTIIITLLLVLLLATPALAGYYHNLQIEVSGEYEINTSFTMPEVVWKFTAEGIGDLKLNSLITTSNFSYNWWELF